MDKTLQFVSIPPDLWTLIFTWANLLILFLLVKKLLFKPIMNVIKQREDEVGKMYEEAQTAGDHAKAMEAEYTEKLAAAKSEAEGIVADAVQSARERADQIVRDSQAQAAATIESANVRIAREQKAAIEEAKGEICSMAVMIASKVIEKEMDADSQSAFVEKCIDEMGEAK